MLLRLGMACSLLMGTASLAVAEQPAETSQPAASDDGGLAAVSDPVFERYVSMDLLRRAWEERDPQLLTDVALELAEGERILLRSHKAISADQLLQITIHTAARAGDREALKRLREVVQGRSDGLQKQLASALALAGKSRANGPAVQVSLDASVEQLEATQALARQIKAAQLRGDRDALQTLLVALEADRSGNQAGVRQLAGVARSALAESGKEGSAHALASRLDRIVAAVGPTDIDLLFEGDVLETTPPEEGADGQVGEAGGADEALAQLADGSRGGGWQLSYKNGYVTLFLPASDVTRLINSQMGSLNGYQKNTDYETLYTKARSSLFNGGVRVTIYADHKTRGGTSYFKTSWIKNSGRLVINVLVSMRSNGRLDARVPAIGGQSVHFNSKIARLMWRVFGSQVNIEAGVRQHTHNAIRRAFGGRTTVDVPRRIASETARYLGNRRGLSQSQRQQIYNQVARAVRQARPSLRVTSSGVRLSARVPSNAFSLRSRKSSSSSSRDRLTLEQIKFINGKFYVRKRDGRLVPFGK